MGKYKEFYVNEDDYAYYIKKPDFDTCDDIHVIEYSAYQKAVEALKCYRHKEGQKTVVCGYGESKRTTFGMFAEEVLKELGEIE